jgi:hypothetical protein
MENTHSIDFFLPVKTQVRDSRRPGRGSKQEVIFSP